MPGKRAVVATWGFGLAQVSFSGALYYQNWVISRFQNGAATAADIDQSDVVVLVFAVAFLVIVVTSFAINGRFLLLASRNAAATVPDPKAITPGWAVGWYFVPIANWWMPYRAMKETWTRLRPGDSTVPGWVTLWWLTWVGLAMFDQFGDFGANDGSLQGYVAENNVMIVSGILWIIPTLLFARIVRTLANSQYDPVEVFA